MQPIHRDANGLFRAPTNRQLSYRDKDLPKTPFEKAQPVTRDEEVDLCDENDQPRKAWRPKTLGLPVLLWMFLVSIGLIVILQVLASISRRNNGIIFATSPNAFSTWQSFCYLYLPVMLSVLYGLAWSWIDLDAQRLEPWFQLSKSGGALGRDSVLLDYTSDYMALVPIKALKRRHWTVLATGIASVLVSWAITPLTGAIFSADYIESTTEVAIQHDSVLASPSEQVHILNANFFNDAYAYLYLNASLPSFSTDKFALLPFRVDTHSSAEPRDNITGHTQLYSTSLDCTPAEFIPGEDEYTGSFTNGEGCTSEFSPGSGMSESSDLVSYLGWFSSGAGIGLSDFGCPNRFSNTFFGFWGRVIPNMHYGSKTDLTGRYRNYTALFCAARYEVQDVSAVISASDFAVRAVQPLGPARPISETLFNSTNFNYLLSCAVRALGESDASQGGLFGTSNSDIADAMILSSDSTLQNTSLDLTYPPDLADYAFSNEKLNIGSLSDPRIFANVFEHAHQTLFTMAIARLIEAGTAASTSNGTHTRRMYAVTVVTPFQVLVQSFLLILASLAMILVFLGQRRSLKLQHDPSSIASVMRLVAKSTSLASIFANDLEPDADLRKRIGEFRFWLRKAQPEGLSISVEASFCDRHPRNTTQNHTMAPSDVKTPGAEDHKQSVRPLEMRLLAGAMFILLLASAICVLSVLRQWINHVDGLLLTPTMTDNSFVRQLSLNYVPIAFATAAGSFWLLLNRTYSLLRPFDVLWQGGATAKSSIASRFASIPPQLNIIRAFKTRHIIFVLLCSVTLLSDLLSVAMSGLFVKEETLAPQHVKILPQFSPQFTSTVGQETLFEYQKFDPFYLLQANLSKGIALPPWVNEGFYFIPFNIPANVKSSTLSAITRGFGIAVDCVTASTTVYGLSSQRVQFEIPQANGQGLETCSVSISTSIYDSNLYSMSDLSSERFAAEFVGQYSAQSLRGCDGWVSFNWMRTKPRPGEPILDAESANKTPLAASSGACAPKLQSALFHITVDAQGHVLAASPVSDLEDNVDRYFYSHLDSQKYIWLGTQQLFGQSTNQDWHNHQFAGTWVNYFLKLWFDSSAVVDPNADVPDFTSLEPAIQGMMRRFWAIYASLQTDWFEDTDTSNAGHIKGTVWRTEERLFFAPYKFELAVSILAFHLLVAGSVYSRRPRRFLPRMPTYIASLIPYFANSHITLEMAEGERWEKSVLGFGKFIGTDGRPHTGVERHPLVQPLGGE